MKNNFNYLYYRVRFHKVNVVGADGMAPCVTRSSAPMMLIMQNREALVPTWSWHQIRQPHIREYEASEYEA